MCRALIICITQTNKERRQISKKTDRDKGNEKRARGKERGTVIEIEIGSKG